MKRFIKRGENEHKEKNRAFMSDTKTSELLIVILKAHL